MPVYLFKLLIYTYIHINQSQSSSKKEKESTSNLPLLSQSWVIKRADTEILTLLGMQFTEVTDLECH